MYKREREGKGEERTAPQLPQVLLEPSDEAPHLGQAVPCMLGRCWTFCVSLRLGACAGWWSVGIRRLS